jgi:drug/metabolite transporter (DMT)-like permease
LLWGAIATSLVGLALLTGAAAEGLRSGDLFTLACAASFGLHVALLDRYSKGCQAGPLVLAQLLAATLIFAVVWLLTEPFRLPPPEVWPALLITGLVATSLGYFVQTFVQQRLSAVETAMVILTEPIFAVIFGYLLHGDRLSGLQILGGLLMVVALFATELVPLLRNVSRQTDKEGIPR